MASQLQPGSSTHGTATRAPPPPASVKAPAYRASVQKCPVLLDWWLEREQGEGGKIRVAGYTKRNRAARVFTSGSITMRHADGTLETADGLTVLIRGPLNITRMHQNGFPDEVTKWFKFGFPVEWEKHANSNMKPADEHEVPPSKSTEYYIEKFLRGSFINSMGYGFMGNYLNTSKGSTGDADGPPIERLSTLPNGTPHIQESTGTTGDKVEEESETPECGKTFVHLGTEDALEVPTKGLDQQFGVVQGSEDNTVRRLRNGKIFGMSSGATLKKRYSKRKTMQHETFNTKMISNETPADLTSRENVNKYPDIQDKAKRSSTCMPLSVEPRKLRSGVPSGFQPPKELP